MVSLPSARMPAPTMITCSWLHQAGRSPAHPFIYKNLPYKPADLLPIARVSNTIVVMAVPAALEVKSLAELVAMVRAQPGKLNWAGTTASNEFLFAAFLKNAGASTCQKFPIGNLVEAANDSGDRTHRAQRDGVRDRATTAASRQGQAVGGDEYARAAVVPDVPMVTEAGYPELALDGLVGFFGPPSMPDRVRESIAVDVREAMDPVVEERLKPHRAASQFRWACRLRCRDRAAAALGSPPLPRTLASCRPSEFAEGFSPPSNAQACSDHSCRSGVTRGERAHPNWMEHCPTGCLTS